ncbi:MAG: hypothetical protein ACOX47_14265 [Bacillota bacterium]
MSFILSFLNDADKDKVCKVEWNEIKKLKEQLVDVGFAPDEVDYMVKKHTGRKGYTELSRDEFRELKTTLHHQLEMAQKCLDLINGK